MIDIILIIIIIIAVKKYKSHKRSGKKRDFGKWLDSLKNNRVVEEQNKAAQPHIQEKKQVLRPDVVKKEDEYITAETYEIKKEYQYKEASHDEAYMEKLTGEGLNDLEKGIIFSEILAKPVSMRK